MVNQSVWIGIVIGVFFVGLASGYAILTGSANPSNMLMQNHQSMTQNTSQMNSWMPNTQHVQEMATTMKENHDFMQQMIMEMINDPDMRLQMIGHMTENQDAMQQMKMMLNDTGSMNEPMMGNHMNP